MTKNCCYCGQFYTPDKRVGNRQKSCSNPECQKKRKRESHKNWKAKNLDCDKGRYANTKSWREQNPGYQKAWRKKTSEIRDEYRPSIPMKSIRCLVPVNLLKNEIQDEYLTLTPIDLSTYKGVVGDRDTRRDRLLPKTG